MMKINVMWFGDIHGIYSFRVPALALNSRPAWNSLWILDDSKSP